jgi:hypothetical protein
MPALGSGGEQRVRGCVGLCLLLIALDYCILTTCLCIRNGGSRRIPTSTTPITMANAQYIGVRSLEI